MCWANDLDKVMQCSGILVGLQALLWDTQLDGLLSFLATPGFQPGMKQACHTVPQVPPPPAPAVDPAVAAHSSPVSAVRFRGEPPQCAHPGCEVDASGGGHCLGSAGHIELALWAACCALAAWGTQLWCEIVTAARGVVQVVSLGFARSLVCQGKALGM